ncbi:hypothetical protein ACFWSF_36840 [Streptomyces sp. NPDC058611]|uniref:hypothetical protein n=1 Tax=unclassified Streptomyces TaxID=2593676 RepID=UPI0036526987
MSGGSTDLEMDPVAVQNIQDGLRSAVGELREFAMDTSAVAGGGMSQLALTGMEAGHPAVAAALEGFCERWDMSVSSLFVMTSGLAERHLDHLGAAGGPGVLSDTSAAAPFFTPHESGRSPRSAGAFRAAPLLCQLRLFCLGIAADSVWEEDQYRRGTFSGEVDQAAGSRGPDGAARGYPWPAGG